MSSTRPYGNLCQAQFWQSSCYPRLKAAIVQARNNREATILGAAEFTIFGNILMGIMAIAGVGSLLYAFEATLCNPSTAIEHVQLDNADPLEVRKAA